MAIDIGVPVTTSARIFERLPFHRSHLPERFGLFTIIVLGETVVSVTAASADIDWTLRAGLVALGGFATVACLWWIYFDLLDLGALRGTVRTRFRAVQVSFYGHLPLLIALTGVGAGTKLAIDRAAEGSLDAGSRATLLGGAALALVVMAAIELAAEGTLRDRELVGRLSAAASLVALALAGGGLSRSSLSA